MTPPIRNLLLSLALIAVPSGGFALAEYFMTPAALHAAADGTAAHGLGDLSAYDRIVRDTRALADAGDMPGAERRITDLETLWDDNEAVLRKADRLAWTTVDDAADAAFAALRARTPDPAQVRATLTALRDVLAQPVPAASTGEIRFVDGIAVTDDTGHALPCEEMVTSLRDALKGTTPAPDVAALQSKALERCTADDDTRADAFAAQALALLKG
ncbi:hypothetical protein [Chachezhania sediminis]|uniref:hypothetical protein n=1 Tax=Chachezhania sediminis TaxID=2599291 RepID=UPI00131E46DA|nr:hypothetical protein [Chachezhania sediminis]